MSAALRGKTIAFSGTFNDLKRSQIIAQATAAGAIVNRGISKNLDLLITGDSNVGVKKVQAKHLGIKTIPSKSFLQFVKAGGSARMVKSAAPMKAVRAPVRRVQAEDFEEEEQSGLMPWETEAAPVRRAAAPMMVRRQAPVARQTMSFRPRVSEPIARRQAPVRAKTPFFQIDGLNIGFAGSFLKMKKIQAAAMAEKSGANVIVTSGPQVDILVCGAGAQAKRLECKKKGILPISESTFIAACRQ